MLVVGRFTATICGRSGYTDRLPISPTLSEHCHGGLACGIQGPSGVAKGIAFAAKALTSLSDNSAACSKANESCTKFCTCLINCSGVVLYNVGSYFPLFPRGLGR